MASDESGELREVVEQLDPVAAELARSIQERLQLDVAEAQARAAEKLRVIARNYGIPEHHAFTIKPVDGRLSIVYAKASEPS